MIMRSVKLWFLIAVLILTACESKGPQSHATFPDRSTDDLFYETMEAAKNNSYVYMCSVELYYQDNGEWEYYGTAEVYNYPNGKSECNDWVKFGNDMMPVYYTNKGGYTFRTRYMGVDYYF